MYYHIADIENIDTIMHIGLRVGSNNVSSNTDCSAIYVTSDYEELLRIDYEFKGRKLGLLQIDLEGIEHLLEIDPEFDNLDDWVWFIRKDIEPERIRFIGSLDITYTGTTVKVDIE